MKITYHKSRLFASFLISLSAGGLATGADFSWTGASPLGGGNSNMSNAANWSGPNAPPNTGGTADLIFSGIARTTPNADVNYTINTLRFTSLQSFTIGGNPITLQTDGGVAPLIRNEASVLNRINNSVTFQNSGSVRAQNGNLTLGGVFGTGTDSGNPNTITLTADTGRTITFSSSVGGFGSLSKTGAGTVRFNGTGLILGSFTMGGGLVELSGTLPGNAGLTMNAGTVRLLANDRIPTVPLTFSGTGTLDLNGFSDTVGAVSGIGNITLGNGGVLTVNQSVNTSFSGTITGSGAAGLTKSGSGIFTLVANASYTGPTTVSAGTLRSGSNNNFSPNSALSIAGGATLEVQNFAQTIGGLSGTGALALSSGSLTVNQAADSVFGGSITGSGSFTKSGGGTLQLTASNPSFIGPAVVSAGRLVVGNSGALGTSGSGTTVQSGGTLEIASTMGLSEALTLSGTGAGGIGALRVSASTTGIMAQIFGNVTLAGDSSITVAKEGTPNSTLALGQPNTTSVVALGTHSLTIDGNSGSVNNYYHKFTGSGELILDAPRLVTLHGDNSGFSGAVDVRQGNLRLLNDLAVGTGTAEFRVAANSDLQLSSGAFGANVATDRQMFLSGNMVTSVSAAWSGAGQITIFGGSRFLASGPSTLLTLGGSGLIFGATNATFETANSGSILVTRPITLNNGGGLVKTNGGTLQLNGSCFYTGQTLVSGGTLRMGAANVLPAASNVSLANNTTLDLNGFSQSVGHLTGLGAVTLGSATLTLITTTNATHSGNISGTGGVEIAGNFVAAQTFSSNNGYTGPTRVLNNGRLIVGANGALSAGATLTVIGGGHVRLDATGPTVGGLAGGGTVEFGTGGDTPRTLTVNTSPTASSFTGNLNGNGRLVVSGSGTLVVHAASLGHTGETRVSGGSLDMNVQTNLPSTPLFIETGGRLTGNGTITSLDLSGTVNPSSQNGIGQFNTGVTTIRQGARYQWKVGIWNGAPVAGYSVIDASSLSLTATPAEPLRIRIDAAADMSNFSETSRVFKLVRCATPITGYNPAAIVVEYFSNERGLTGTWATRITGNDLELVYTPAGADTYQAWIAGFDVGGLDAPGDDPDSDGIPNGIEYVIGGNPGDGDDSDKLPEVADDGDHFKYVFRRATRSVYLSPRAEHSTDLQNPWLPAIHGQAGVSISTLPLEAGFEEITVRIPKNSADKKFARLAIEIPPG